MSKREDAVRLWNTMDYTLSEIAEILDQNRGAIGRALTEARAMGEFVWSPPKNEVRKRNIRASRKRFLEDPSTYLAALAYGREILRARRAAGLLK